MIDYLALTIGHGLLALAFWRLFLRDSVDRDPLLEQIRQAEADNRKRTSAAGRNAARRAGEDGGPDHGKLEGGAG